MRDDFLLLAGYMQDIRIINLSIANTHDNSVPCTQEIHISSYICTDCMSTNANYLQKENYSSKVLAESKQRQKALPNIQYWPILNPSLCCQCVIPLILCLHGFPDAFASLPHSDAPINWQNIRNQLIGNIFKTSVIGIS